MRKLGTHLCLIRSPLNNIAQEKHVNRKEQLENRVYMMGHHRAQDKHTGGSAEVLKILAAYLMLTSCSEPGTSLVVLCRLKAKRLMRTGGFQQLDYTECGQACLMQLILD